MAAPSFPHPSHRPALTRRALLGGGVALIAAGALAGCGSGDSAGAKGRGGTLTVGFDNEPTTLDPALSSAISSDRSVLNLFYDTLLRQQRDGSFVPALAEKWTVEGTTVTFTLRAGVTFHDGTPFDAEAAAFNLRRVIDPATKSTKAGALKKLAAVDVVDPRTLRLTLKATDPLLLVQLAHEPGMMASPTAVKAGEYGRKPVGTGPFVFDAWRSKVQLTGKRNPKYWRKAADGTALPRLDQVVYRFVTDTKVLRAEISTGGVQLVRVLPPEEFGQLKSDRQVVLEDIGVRRSYYVALNTTRAPFNDPKLREAFAMAVDRAGVGKAAAAGEFDLAPSFATRNDWFFDGSITPPPLNPAKAKAALGGRPVPITVVARRRAPDPTIAELLQSQLTAAGFDPKVEVLEAQTQLDRMRKQDFDAALLVIDIPRLDPSLSFDPYFASKGSNNWSGLADAELDGLLEKAVGTEDRAVRKQAYVDVQRRIVGQNYWVFLHQPRSPLIHSAKLTGIVLNVDGQWRLDEAELAS
ncbi:ABC transporter substrate-binding protein [Micromonospora sp. CPCC 205556]|uniref:ABC transporter substrate-binding protein n=1 Tax=Micromonospora sp. CPCC 205556 TaxID=3122398 RepID=UPI002FF245B0